MCLCTKGMPESTTIVSVEAAGQVYSKTNDFVYLGGNVNHNADMSIEVNRRIPNAYWKYTLEQYKRPSTPLELKIQMLRAEALETMLYGCHLEPARLPLRHAAPSPPQLPDSLRRLAKAQSHRPPNFLSGHAYEDGK